MIAPALLLLALGAGPEKFFVPIQADVSAAGGFDDRPARSLALFVGWAHGVARPGWASPFGAAGFELTYSAYPDPYRMSLGAQLRAGYAWGADRGQPEVLPDLAVYARVTPFVGGSGGRHGDSEEEEGPTPPPEPVRTVVGLRAGVGVTGTSWTRTFLADPPYGDTSGAYGDAMRVLATLLVLPIALLNHAELTVELLAARPVEASLGFRVGTGF